MPKVSPEIEQCLQSGDAASALLHALILRMKEEGQTQAEVLAFFGESRAALREQDREADEDEVMDWMDVIVGWCSPGFRIF